MKNYIDIVGENVFYSFIDAVKASKKILGEDEILLVDNSGTEWDHFNLLDVLDDVKDGDEYWVVGIDGNIGLTENNGYNVEWIYTLSQ